MSSSAPAMGASASASSASSPQEAWLMRIASVQREKATPEQLERMRERAEAMRRTKVKAKKASRIQTSMSLSSSAYSGGMRAMSHTPARSAELGSRARDAMRMMSSPEVLSVSSPAHATLEEEEAAEDMLEEQLSFAVAQQVAQGSLAMEDVAAQQSGGQAADTAQQASLESALKEVETEPSDAAACAAKFELYEGFAKLTEDARNATHALWADSAADFDAAPATKAQIEREIARVDHHNNLGIQDDPRRWFVHAMCKAAARNQTILNGVLGGIKTKLELLSSQTECPICYEAFGADRPPTTLGCAHQTCEECWTHWRAVGGGICPLCRQQEFMHRVFSAAGDAV